MPKTIKIDRGIAVPFRITQDKQIIVSNHHFGMNEDGEWEKNKGPGRPTIGFHVKEMSASEKKTVEIVKNRNLSDQKRAAGVYACRMDFRHLK